MQQHAKAIDGRVATPARPADQIGFERDVDEIGDESVRWKGVEVDVERRLAGAGTGIAS